jgi:hypothetical protein
VVQDKAMPKVDVTSKVLEEGSESTTSTPIIIIKNLATYLI